MSNDFNPYWATKEAVNSSKKLNEKKLYTN